MPTHNILAIDDDRFFTRLVCHAARIDGHTIDECNDAAKLNQALLKNYEFILLDIMMPEVNGVEMLGRIRTSAPDAKVVLMTAVDSKLIDKIVAFAREIGISIAGVLSKPFRRSELSLLLKSSHVSARQDEDAAKRNNALLAEVQNAIATGKAFIALQPQVSLHTNQWVGCEASLNVRNGRSAHQVSSESVYQLHEPEFGVRYDLHVIQQAVECVRTFSKATGAQCNLCVRVSHMSISAPNFADRLIAIIQQPVAPKVHLTLDLQSTPGAFDSAQFRNAAASLRRHEIRLALRGNLPALAAELLKKERMFDEVKIAGDALRGAYDSQQGRGELKSLFDFAAKACVVSVAEGVKDRELLKFLTINGCDLAQGSIVSKPLITADLVFRFLSQTAASDSAP